MRSRRAPSGGPLMAAAADVCAEWPHTEHGAMSPADVRTTVNALTENVRQALNGDSVALAAFPPFVPVRRALELLRRAFLERAESPDVIVGRRSQSTRGDQGDGAGAASDRGRRSASLRRAAVGAGRAAARGRDGARHALATRVDSDSRRAPAVWIGRNAHADSGATARVSCIPRRSGSARSPAT